jgi:hypothetical protein
MFFERKDNPCLQDRLNESYYSSSDVFLKFEEMKQKIPKNKNYKKSDINKSTVRPYNLRAYPWELQSQPYIINSIVREGERKIMK